MGNRFGKFALSLNERREHRAAELRRAYKHRTSKMNRRAIRIVLNDVRVRGAQS